MNYIKAKNWDGKALKGKWNFTYKVDGVRALKTEDGWVSRNGKPLYNLENLPDFLTDIEVFKKDWSTSVSMVRTKKGDPVSWKDVHSLSPFVADDIDMNIRLEDPGQEIILHHLWLAKQAGYEGLVLRQGDTWLKVKTIETYDVPVTGAVEGKGKHAGKLGAFITDMGKVGTGFTDEERQDLWRKYQTLNTPITIEVECMELTPAGKFRHPRFVRVRFDK